MSKQITAERLREVLDYDPLTGIFTWKARVANCVHIGDVAGTKGRQYISIKVDGVLDQAHILAWLYIHGVWPEGEIDHENEIKTDNRIVNLREATRSQNMHNQSKPRKSNKSGYHGVSWHRASNSWIAQIGIDGKRKHLGCFDTPELAYKAYLTAKVEAHPFWNGEV